MSPLESLTFSHYFCLSLTLWWRVQLNMAMFMMSCHSILSCIVFHAVIRSKFSYHLPLELCSLLVVQPFYKSLKSSLFSLVTARIGVLMSSFLKEYYISLGINIKNVLACVAGCKAGFDEISIRRSADKRDGHSVAAGHGWWGCDWRISSADRRRWWP